MRLPHLLALSLLAMILSSPAAATVYCVNSVSTLNSAFSSANSAAEGSTHDIRIRPGTYNVPNGLEFNPDGDKDGKNFSMTGGWNSDCSARTTNASATVLNANAASPGAFRFFGNNTHYVIEGIRFINFAYFSLDDANCGFNCPDTELIRFRYNELRNGTSTWQGAVVYIRAKDAATLNVSNNLFANFNPGSGKAVRIDYVNNETIPIIAFNTVARVFCSSSSGDALAIYTERSGVVLHHNLVQSTGCGGDIHVSTGSSAQPIALRNNLYNSVDGLAPSLVANNVISNDPGFIDGNNGDFRLRETAPQSLAINAGMTPQQAQSLGLAAQIPSQDIDGPAGLRLVGTRYDIGAYESSINNASVLTVTKTADTNDGVCNSDCSLREAIVAANAAPGLQTIQFNIPGGCSSFPHIIQLGSLLPDIGDSLEIDGYSQPQSAANTLETGSDAQLCIALVASPGTLAQALQVPQSAPANTSLTVKGLAFSSAFATFTVAIRLRGGSNHVIQGNAFGGIGPGNIGSLGSLNFGLQIRDDAQNVLVGGSSPEHRNSFGGNTSSAIVINDATSSGHRIENNYIGVSASGALASPIGLNGIFASNSPNLQILDNVIAAVPNDAALRIHGASATGYLIQRNRIGTSAFNVPTAAFRNRWGIVFANGTGNHRVGSAAGQILSNTIANSDEAGVWITSSAGNGITVRPNRVFSNGLSGTGLGVDIGELGQSVNDPLDPDGGANNGQNWPEVMASLPNADGSRQVGLLLQSNPNTQFRIDVYRSPSCPGGRGDMFNRIGTVVLSTSAQGQLVVSAPMSGDGSPGVLVAQATNLSTLDSSEGSLCFVEPAATTTAITGDTPDPSMIGQNYQVSVLVSSTSGTPGGSVVVDDGGGNSCNITLNASGSGSCAMASTSVGTKTLTASYQGSIAHAPSSGSANHQVVPATTTTTIVSHNPNPSAVNQPYTVVVQVRTPPGNLATPGGQVAVSDGSGQTCQIVSLTSGEGSCQLTSVSPGLKVLSANYAGAINFQPSSGTASHSVTSNLPDELFANGFE